MTQITNPKSQRTLGKVVKTQILPMWHSRKLFWPIIRRSNNASKVLHRSQCFFFWMGYILVFLSIISALANCRDVVIFLVETCFNLHYLHLVASLWVGISRWPIWGENWGKTHTDKANLQIYITEIGKTLQNYPGEHLFTEQKEKLNSKQEINNSGDIELCWQGGVLSSPDTFIMHLSYLSIFSPHSTATPHTVYQALEIIQSLWLYRH